MSSYGQCNPDPIRSRRAIDEMQGTAAVEAVADRISSPLPRPLQALLKQSAFVTMLAVIVTPGVVQAHNLKGAYRAGPGGRIEIEGWYDPGGHSATGAAVEVRGKDGTLVASGVLDDAGMFAFDSTRKSEEFVVVISAPGGHRRELHIKDTGQNDRTHKANEVDARGPPPGAQEDQLRPFADRSSTQTVRNAAIGLAIILALAAILLGWRTQRRRGRTESDPKGRPS